jgi:CheY-like chemotaxis protein
MPASRTVLGLGRGSCPICGSYFERSESTTRHHSSYLVERDRIPWAMEESDLITLLTEGAASMIMILTHQSELREQLSESLRTAGHTVTIPPHRQDMLTMLKESNPTLIVLDLYVSDPSGAEDWKLLREHGYQGGIIILAGPSMISVLKGMHPERAARIVQVPAKINGRFHLGELLSTIASCMNEGLQEKRNTHHALVAERAYELYENRGKHDGRDVEDWQQAEKDISTA